MSTHQSHTSHLPIVYGVSIFSRTEQAGKERPLLVALRSVALRAWNVRSARQHCVDVVMSRGTSEQNAHS